MSVSTYRNKTYRIPNLQKHIYLLDASKIEDELHIDYENLSLDEIISNDILKINGTSVTLQENTSIDERYAFAKTLTISIDGYYSIENIGNRYYFVVEDYHNNQYLVNFDLPSLITYQYDVDNSVNQTTYTFQILSNFPLVRLINNISATSEQRHCRYWYGNAHKIKMIEKNYVALNKETKEIIIANNETFKEIEPLTFNLSENYNGNDFTTTVSFTIPLSEYKSYWQYSLLEFTLNRYSMIIEPFVGENDIYIGFGEFGLAPNYTISTDGDNIVTITLTTTERIYTNEPFETHQDGQLFWIPISSVTTDHDEYMTSFECSSTDGYAKYLLIKEVNAFGEPTGNYKVLEGYEEDYANFINIVGTFDNEILFPNDDCKFHCSTISSIPNLIVFSAVTSYTYTVNSLCDWNITHNLPNGVVISPLTGEAGITNVTISCNDISANEGLYTLVLHTAEEDIPTQVSVRLSQNESYYKEIDARRQNVYFVTAFDLLSIQSGDVDKIAAYEIENNIIKIVIPRNDTTESRIFELHGINMYGSLVDFYIEQYGIIQEWREEDDEYICVSGDLYTVATLWTGYTQTDLRRTNEQRANTMSVPRSEECEQYYKWQWNGDTVCVDGDLYQQLTEMRSSDGYEWFETENTMQGDLIEKYSLECAENVYSISAYTTDEVGSSIWTTMIVNINGSSTTYSDTSACTFSVAEGCPFEIVFADKTNYFKPEPITGIAVANTSYTGVYTTQMSYSIGVTTIDENRNYIITDITACVNNNCTTYSDVSGITVTAPSGSSYSLDFGTVEGYITPSGISSTTTANVNHVVVYELEGIKYSITVNTEDNNGNPIVTNYIVCINGECNLVENVSSHTFSVRENDAFLVQFDNVFGYYTPSSISSTATTDTSYTAIYEAKPSYSITVNSVDENDNGIITNMIVCIAHDCNLVENVSSTTFSVMEGLNYSVQFDNVLGYYTPRTLTGVSTASTSHTVVYTSKPTYSLTINTVDDNSTAVFTNMTICINGICNTYQNVSSYTVSAKEGSEYNITFDDIQGYYTPNAVTGVLNGNTTRTAVYSQYPNRNVTIYTVDDNGDGLLTDITILYNEQTIVYQNVSAQTFQVRENNTFGAIFSNVYGYVTPDSFIDIVTADTSYTVVYDSLPSYNITVNTVDDNGDGILTDLTICVDGTCNLYQNVSSYTFNTIQGSEYNITFGSRLGYLVPIPISGTTTGNTTYTVVYHIHSNSFRYVSDGEYCGSELTGTAIEANVAYVEVEGYLCSGTTKYKKMQEYIVKDGEYSSTMPAKYTYGSVIENNSIDCGFVPPTPDYKAYIQRTNYCGEISEWWIQWNGSTVLTASEIQNHIPNSQYTYRVITYYGITEIGSEAFQWCHYLKYILLERTLETIGSYAFRGCDAIERIELPDSLLYINTGAFQGCKKLKSIIIPNNVSSIGNSAFYGCSGLTSVTIGESVSTLGNTCFENCSRLNKITSLNTTAPTIGSNVFYGLPSSGTLYYPTGSDYSTWINALPSGWTAITI